MNKEGFQYSNTWFDNGIDVWEDTIKPEVEQVTHPNILVVGVFEGRDVVWMLDNFPDVHITAVDTFGGNEEHAIRGWDLSDLEQRFRNNILQSGHTEAVTILKGYSQDILPHLEPDTYDLIYIDGDHAASTVSIDLYNAHHLLKPSGILVCDDYQWNPEEFKDQPTMKPKLAIDEFLEQHKYEYDTVYIGWQVALKKREYLFPE